MSNISSYVEVQRVHGSTKQSVANIKATDFDRLLKDFPQRQLRDKTILLQGLDPSTCFVIFNTALQNGWTTIILGSTPDLKRNHIPSLSSYLFVSATQSPSVSGDLPVKGHSLSESIFTGKEDQCAAILFTSGSTGCPKGVCHSYGNLLRSAQLFVNHFELTENDYIYCLAPVHSMSGVRCLMLPRITSIPITFHYPENDSFLSIIKKISILRPTRIICGPVFLHQVAAYGRRVAGYLQSVDTFLSTGAELLQKDRSSIEELLQIQVLNYYGLTETAGIVLAEKVGSQTQQNLPPPCNDVEIKLEPTDRDSDVYHLYIKSDNLFIGYIGEPLSRRKIINTGDLVKREPDGNLSFVGRIDNSFKAPSTRWLYPHLLEEWLRKQNFMSDSVVKGVPVPGGHGCGIWFENETVIDRSNVESAIIEQFGSDYKPVAWHQCSITRDPLGKIKRIDKT